MTIAIDGPVASGKTVVGRLVATRLGIRFLDTGIMYRAATWAAIERGIDLEDMEALSRLVEGLKMEVRPAAGTDRLLVDGEDVTVRLRDERVEEEVSLVSRAPGVRSALVRSQRAIAGVGPIVMVGRDIGTVVLPNAAVKVFMRASPEVRARRRHLELLALGGGPSYERVLSDLARRDALDSERADSPLRPAEDAVQLDTDGLTIEEVAEKILSLAGRC